MSLGPIRCTARALGVARGCSIGLRGGQVALTPGAQHMVEWRRQTVREGGGKAKPTSCSAASRVGHRQARCLDG